MRFIIRGLKPELSVSRFGLANAPRSAAERWALHVVRACESDGDLRTIEEWATVAALSRTSLCESCRLLDIRPHDARDLARFLRAVVNSPRRGLRIESMLDVRDRRTLRKLFERAGLDFKMQPGLVSVTIFLNQQQFVAHHNDGLTALRGLVQ